MPLKDEPEKVPLFAPKDKLFHVLSESVRWGDQQGIDTVGALNDMITQDDMREIVLVQEAFQERKIGEIAKQIADMTGRKTMSFQSSDPAKRPSTRQVVSVSKPRSAW